MLAEGFFLLVRKLVLNINKFPSYKHLAISKKALLKIIEKKNKTKPEALAKLKYCY